MNKIEEKYNYQKNLQSDINEHLTTLYEYAKNCKHITEMGVRWVSSTWAFLLSDPKKLISYDIKKLSNIDEVIELSNEYSLNYIFIEADVLSIRIEPTELLFIDTLHTYNQLYSELLLHSDDVSKFIIMHDTETFGRRDENIYPHASEIVKQKVKNKQGLMSAIEDFLITPQGQNWEIHKHFKNNNGLTILEKK